ncbi:hypothetical protein SASPL_113678 [Salvia splendens]|uniref:Myb-like domain-containing protein n=1 Tax=Salvia splendens TaxID=180675 RepID=A0A8X8Y514_SALSN|nr:trihelix transcription factor ASIL1-like [Salvia splendens]KAG6423286.1 hypothetical protein SASPL_113678 [Salvia splendens]
MATIISPSSPDDIPTTTPTLPAPRRLPPPCWTPEETVVLIDAYKDKWYSLSRGSLRGHHWQEVADDVASRCPAHPAKTSVQCRHKMEKLRKRYRADIQRSAARRSASSWAHFQQMHSMEKGTDLPTPPPSSSSEEEHNTKSNSVKRRINDLYNRHANQSGASTPGVRIKMPGAAAKAPNPNPRIVPNSSGKPSVVEAIQALGEGFVRMEQMKMEMAQQIEEMRMEMELKRTEMILDSQRRIVDAFARAIKKPKNHL